MYLRKSSHHKSLWRMFAMLLSIALILQSTGLTAFAADDPQSGSETLSGETLPASSATDDEDPFTQDGENDEILPGTGSQTENTAPGNSQESADDPSANSGTDTSSDDDNLFDFPMQDETSGETNESGSDLIIMEEDMVTGSFVPKNVGGENDIIEAGTTFKIRVIGLGFFTDNATNDSRYQYDNESGSYVFVYTLSHDMSFTELFGIQGQDGARSTLSDELSQYITSASNFSYFEWWYDADWVPITSAQNLASTSYVYAMFYNENVEYNLSPAGTAKTTRRININDGPQKFALSLSLYDEETGSYSKLPENVRFGDWEVEDPATAPFTVKTDSSDSSVVTITPVHVGEATVSVPLMSTIVSNAEVERYVFRIVIEDENTEAVFPAGRGFNIYISGDGQFTDAAKTDEGYQNDGGWENYCFTAQTDMSWEDIRREIEPLVEVIPGSVNTKFLGWFTDDGSQVEHVDQLISNIALYESIYARFGADIPAGIKYIPAGTRIPLIISGPGVYTQKAKNDTINFDGENYMYTYVCEENMDYAILLTKLQSLVAPAGNFGKRIDDMPWWPSINTPDTDDNFYSNFLNYPEVTAYFTNRSYGTEITPLPSGGGQYFRMKNNPESPLEVNASLYLMNEDYMTRLSTPVQGVAFGTWNVDPDSNACVSIENDPSKGGHAFIKPLSIGECTVYLDLQIVDGAYRKTFVTYPYKVLVTDPDETVPALCIMGPGRFTDAAKADHRYKNEGYGEYLYYAFKNDSDLDTVLDALASFVEPVGNVSSFNGWFVRSGYNLAPLTNREQITDDVEICASYISKQISVSRSDNRPVSDSLPIRSDADPVTLTFSFKLEDTDEPLEGIVISHSADDYPFSPYGYLSDNIDISAEQSGSDYTLTLDPKDEGTVQITIYVGPPAGENIFSTSFLVEIKEPFANLTYAAFDGTEEIPFYHSNPSAQTAANIRLSLDVPYASGYQFEGWYLEHDPETGVFSQPLPDNIFTNTKTLPDATLYAKFKKTIPVTGIAFKDDLPKVLETGDVLPLSTSIVVEPETNTDTITFTSSNETVLKVVDDSENPGTKKLETVGPGSAVITARSTINPNISASVTMRVVEQILDPASVVIEVYSGGKWVTPEAAKLQEITDNGALQQFKFRAVVKDENKNNATFQDVAWSVSENTGDTFVVSLSEDGVLTLHPSVKSYSFNITATAPETDPVVKSEVSCIVNKPYQVSFQNDKGTAPKAFTAIEGSAIQAVSHYTKDAEKKLLAPEANGYDFEGWYEVVDDTEVIYDINGRNMPARNVVLYAKWAPIEYSFHAHYGFGSFLDDGSGVDYTSVAVTNGYDSEIKYTFDDGNITLEPVTIDGYDFLGWYADNACKTKITAPIAASKWNYTDIYCVLKRTVKEVSFGEQSGKTVVYKIGTPQTVIPKVTPVLDPDPSDPDDTGHDYEITYKSSNTKVAAVSAAGVITPKAAGTAVITASAGTASDSFTVQVIAKAAAENEPAAITISKPKTFKKEYDADTDKNAKIQFTASVTGANGKAATVKAVEWEITEGDAYATVSASGLVTLDLADVTSDGATIKVVATSLNEGSESVKSAPVEINVVRRYTLTFETAVGKAPAKQRLMKSATPTAVTDLRVTGYTFNGWYEKGDDSKTSVKVNGVPDTSWKMPANDVTLVANWEATSITYQFVYGFGNKEGYPQDESLQFLFGSKPADADGYPLTYPVENSISGQAGQAVEKNTVFKVSEAGVNQYYRFLGWFTDAKKTKAFNANAAVSSTKDVNIYGKTERVWSISFDLGVDDGTVVNYPDGTIDTQYKKKGEKVTQPAIPVRPGYHFVGWYASETDAEAASGNLNGIAKKKVNFSVALSANKDITYYAAWYSDSKRYTVSYEVDQYSNLYGTFGINVKNASDFDDKQLSYHETFTEPGIPVASGFTFKGWYTDEARTVPFDFMQRITEDTTVYAGWDSELQVKVQFYQWGYLPQGRTPSMIEAETFFVDYGTPIPVEKISLVSGQNHLQKVCVHVDGGTPYDDREAVDLSEPVTSPLDLDLIYYGGLDESGYYKKSPLYNLSVLTNCYETLGDIDLPDYYEWTEPDKAVSSYAGKGVVGVKVNFTGSYKDQTLTIPVRFVTLTGIKLQAPGTNVFSVWDQGNGEIYPHTLSFSITPVLSGISSNAGEREQSLAAAYAYIAEHNGALTAKSSHSNNVSVAIAFDSYGYDPVTGESISSRPVFHATYNKAVSKKTDVTLTCTITLDGQVLKATTKAVVLPISEFFAYSHTVMLLGGESIPVSSDNYSYTIDLDKAKSGKLVLRQYILYNSGSANKSVTVKSSNNNVIKPGKVSKKDADRDSAWLEIPLTVGSAGTVYLSLVANNAAKTFTGISITVRDPETRLLTKSVTLNKNSYYGQTIRFSEGYGDSLYNVTVDSVTPDKSTKSKVKVDGDMMKHWFTLRENGHTAYEIAIDEHADIDSIPAGTYTLKLANHGVVLKQALTMKVTDTQPNITVKQSAPLNLKNTSGSVPVFLDLWNSKDVNYITDVRVIGSNGEYSPYLHDENGDTTWTLSGGETYYTTVGIKKTDITGIVVNTKTNKNITLEMTVLGYRNPVKKTVTLNVMDKVPAAKIGSGAATFYENMGQSFLEATELHLNVGGAIITDLDDWSFELDNKLSQYYDLTVVDRDYTNEFGSFSDDCIVITAKEPVGNKTVSGNIIVSNPALYESTLSAPFKITIGKASAFKPSLRAATVKLNRNAPNDAVYTVLKTNGTGVFTEGEVNILPGAGVTDTVREKLELRYSEEMGNILVRWKDSQNAGTLPAGNYKYTVQVTAVGKTYKLPLTVSVVNTALNKTVTVTQKNTFTKKNPQVTLTLKLAGLNGTITGIRLDGKDAPLFDAYAYATTGNIYMKSDPGQYIIGQSYDVSVASVTVLSPEGKVTIVPVNKKLNMKYQNK